MANKKINELDSRASLSLSDLMAVGDPSTGYLYKTTISDLKTLTGAGVISFNGRFGSVVPVEGDYALTQLSDVIITSATNAQVLQYNGSNWVNASLAANVDTLDIVTGRGNTTANSITVGSVSAAGLSNLLGQLRTFATTGNVYIGANPSTATDAGYKLDVNGTIRATGIFNGVEIRTGAHAFRDQMYITATTDGWTKQGSYNGSSAYTMGFIGDLRFAAATTIKSVFSFNGSYSNNGTVYGGEMSLMKIFTGDAIGQNPVPTANINQYGINLMPTLNYTLSTSNFTGIYYNPTLTATTGLTHYAMNLVAGSVKMGTLAGTGTRLVVTDANGVLSAQAIPSLSGYVPYTGATANLDLGSYTLTAGSIIKTGGTSSQFLKADGSVDSNTYLTSGSSGVFVPYTGATADVTLGNRQLYAKNVIVQPTGFPVLAVLGSDTTGSGYGVMTLTNGATGYFKTNTLVVDRIYTFPDASGTVALTSDLSGYLPLAGGTLTGTTSMDGSGGTKNPITLIYNTGENRLLTQVLRLYGSTNVGSNYVELFGTNATANRTVNFQDASGTVALLSGTQTFSGSTTFSQRVQITGNTAPASGTGLELFYDGSSAGTVALARGTGYIPNIMDGSYLQFFTSSVEKMRVTSSGVGIGTTSPTAQLQVSITSTSQPAAYLEQNASYHGLAVTTSGNSGSYYIANFRSTGVDRMRILDNGLINFGTSGGAGRLNVLANPANNILVEWQNSAGTPVGSVTVNAGTSTVYNTTSDYRLKEDLQDLNGLDKVLRIKTYDYKWKGVDSRMDGVLAHELAEVIPYAVTGQKDGEIMQGVDYSKIVPVLVKAIQELNAEIKNLKSN